MPKYINAENAENTLRQYAEQKHANGEIELANGILKAVCKLKTIPAADAKEVVRGKWVGQSSDYEDFCECSICGHYQDDVSDFCPSCGADMREVK